MAQAFNLTAQLQLQSPRNVDRVVDDIRRRLKPLGVEVKIQNARDITRANKDLAAFSKNAKTSSRNMSELNRTLLESGRRFSVITIATGSMLALVNSFKRGVKEAIAFEKELVKISQVTGKSVKELKGLTDEVTRLSTSLGVSSSDLLNVSRTLTQAGFTARETKSALDALAKTALSASFENIQDTTEGAIALLRQFGAEARNSGKTGEFLEKSLSAISKVSKSFAVESGDLIGAIRRTGGVFAAAGGNIEELLALFTSVRATTRESAETISTGLRTIFTRIQRVETIDQLKEFGIQLQDAQGNFVGAFEAFKRLSQGLKGIDPRSVEFSSLVEELGGFRQVGKVIPLIQQFTTAQQALGVAQSATGELSKDATTAQLAFANQIDKVKESYSALLRKFADSGTIRSIGTFALRLADAFVKVADALEPVLPLLATVVSLRAGVVGATLLKGLTGPLGGAGKISKFAKGGMVPGSGNRDTVPAMLTPGEFVIRKSSVNKLGAGTLAAINENRFASGGKIKVAKTGKVNKGDIENASDSELRDLLNQNINPASRAAIEKRLKNAKGRVPTAVLKDDVVGGLFLQSSGPTSTNFSKVVDQGVELPGRLRSARKIEGNIYTGVLDKKANQAVTSSLGPALEQSINNAAAQTMKSLEITPLDIDENAAAKRAVKKIDLTSIEGFIFEAFISSMSGLNLADPGATFDFPNISNAGKKRLANIFGPDPISGKLLDAKRTLNRETVQSGRSSIANKILAATKNGQISQSDFVVRKNKGGSIAASDTVPALLTPGEFVINKKAAQNIGSANLDRMNKRGVQGFAKGGSVGVQRFAGGGGVAAGGAFDPSTVGLLDDFVRSLEDTTQEVEDLGDSISDVDRSAKKETSTRLNQIRSIASSAQNFVFLGSAATGVASQFSSLEDTTKQAISETAGFIAGVVGVAGSLADVAIGVVQTRLARRAETQAIAINTGAIRAETAARAASTAVGSGGVAAEATGFLGSLKKFGAGLVALAGGPVVIVIAALAGLAALLVFQKNKIKAEYEALGRAAKDLSEKFKETGEGFSATVESLQKLGRSAADQTVRERRTRAASQRSASGGIGGAASSGSVAVADRLDKEADSLAARFANLEEDIKTTVATFRDLKDVIKKQDNTYDRIGSSVFDSALKFDKLSEVLTSNQAILSNLSFDDSLLDGIRGQFENAGDLQEALQDPSKASKELVPSLILLQQETNKLAEAQKFAAESVAKSSNLFGQTLGEISGSDDIGNLSKFLSPAAQQAPGVVGPPERGLAESTEEANTRVERAFKNVANALRQEARFRILQLKIQAAALEVGSEAEIEARKQIGEIQRVANKDIEERIKYAEEVGAIKERKEIADTIKAESDARQKGIESLLFFNSILDDLDGLMSATLGQDANSRSAIATREARRAEEERARRSAADKDLAAVGLGLDSADSLKALLSARQSAVSQKEGLGGGGTGDLTPEEKDQQFSLDNQIRAIDSEIKRRSEQTELLKDMSDSMKDNISLIKEERLARSQVAGVLEEFIVGGRDARASLSQAARGVQFAIGTGSLQNQSEDQRKATVGLLKKLGDVAVTFDRGTGEALTGSDVLKRLQALDLTRAGFPQLANAVYNATSEEEKLINSNKELYNGIIQLNNTIREASGINAQIQAGQLANGGLVQYRANGGSIFKPKGTDTVPAMLSPGEFVIRKSAVDQIGVGNLQTLNSGGSPVYAAGGGSIEELLEQIAGANQASAGVIANRNVNINTGQNTLIEDIMSRVLSGELSDAALQQALKDIEEVQNNPSSDLQFYNPEVRDIKQGIIKRSAGLTGQLSSGVLKNVQRFGNTSLQLEEKGQGVKLRSEDKSFDPFNRERPDGIESFASPIQETKFGFGVGKNVAPPLAADERILATPLIKDIQQAAENEFAAENPGGPYNFARVQEIEKRIKKRQADLKKRQEEIKAKRRASRITDDQGRVFGSAATKKEFEDEQFDAQFPGEALAAKRAKARQDKERLRGRREEYLERRKTSTSAGRRGARFTPRGERGTSRQRARTEGSLDIDAIRRARGMRSRGRTPGGQKFGAQGGFGIGPGVLNFLAGYGGGGFGGGFGGGVPFGFIPGSPFNQLLGRGGFNIPRFDPRLLFGNNARFFNKGGSVGGDTIPAMLTPGEFIMNAGTVKKYGVGFMNKLNKGNVKGFNRGGSVGGVQYRQEGGLLGAAGAMLGFDTSEIQGVFDGFVSNFSSVLDNIVAPFNNVVQGLNQLSQSFGNLTMQHTVNVEGLISVGGLNIESIKNELSQSIGEMVAGEVQRVMNDQQKKYKSN
jgi:TP901 family phage tail tape measure protein